MGVKAERDRMTFELELLTKEAEKRGREEERLKHTQGQRMFFEDEIQEKIKQAEEQGYENGVADGYTEFFAEFGKTEQMKKIKKEIEARVRKETAEECIKIISENKFEYPLPNGNVISGVSGKAVVEIEKRFLEKQKVLQ